jgi:hypothetical protein
MQHSKIVGGSTAKDVVAAIRKAGIYEMGGTDGCLCTDFELYNVGVCVSCHKSEQTIRVWFPYSDYGDGKSVLEDPELKLIADEVLRQVHEIYGKKSGAIPRFAIKFSPWEAI